jgi:hypothetical protein
VTSEPDSTLFLEISVHLGPEWTPDPGAGAPASKGRAWWDPRGWFGGTRDEGENG